jgi:hypothetical protein
MTKACKYRVRASRDLLGYVYARDNGKAWRKAVAKWGMLVMSVEML